MIYYPGLEFTRLQLARHFLTIYLYFVFGLINSNELHFFKIRFLVIFSKHSLTFSQFMLSLTQFLYCLFIFLVFFPLCTCNIKVRSLHYYKVFQILPCCRMPMKKIIVHFMSVIESTQSLLLIVEVLS